MDASARSKAEMAQKIAQELLKSSGHRMGMTSQSMPALNSEQSNIVRAAQQKAAEIAIQASPLHAPVCIAGCGACSSLTQSSSATPATFCRQVWQHTAALLSDMSDVFAGLWSGCSWHSVTQHECFAHGNLDRCSARCLAACDDLSWQIVCHVVLDCTRQTRLMLNHSVLHVRMKTGCCAHLCE